MTDLEALKAEAGAAAVEPVGALRHAAGPGQRLDRGEDARRAGRAARPARLADIAGVPTSEATAARCRELGIPLLTLDERPELDVVIDGADEIDPGLA